MLVFLTGGPGQPGVPFLNRIRSRLGAEIQGYRLVMLDQRGTGAGALHCPALQKAAGSSDLVMPPPGAVTACAASIGSARRFYTTAETVADLDSLRVALHVARLTLDGVSYGTFVAERYALAYPQHTARLVLDSVVPQQGADALYAAALRQTGPVLRSVCAEQHCGFDPARDLATIVRTRHDGPAAAQRARRRERRVSLVTRGSRRLCTPPRMGIRRASTNCWPACAAARPLRPTRSARGFTRAACASSLRPRGTPRRARPNGER